MTEGFGILHTTAQSSQLCEEDVSYYLTAFIINLTRPLQPKSLLDITQVKKNAGSASKEVSLQGPQPFPCNPHWCSVNEQCEPHKKQTGNRKQLRQNFIEHTFVVIKVKFLLVLEALTLNHIIKRLPALNLRVVQVLFFFKHKLAV